MSSVLISSCSVQNTGSIQPLAANDPVLDSRLSDYGVSDADIQNCDIYVFDYDWDYPAPEIRVWIEVYKKGKSVSEPPVDLYKKNNEGKTGTIYLLSKNGQSPWWNIGVSNEWTNGGSSSFMDGTDAGLHEIYASAVSVVPENKFDIAPLTDTDLMALVYSNDSSAPPFTFAEMQKDPGVLENVDVAVILKCRFSQGKIESL